MRYINYKVKYILDEKTHTTILKDIEKNNNHYKIIDMIYNRIALKHNRSTSVINLISYKETKKEA